MGNTFGRLFRVTTWGESHGGAVGAVVDGCPPNFDLSEELIQTELDRRKPGQSKLVTQRREADKVQLLSGVFEGKTTGMPIMMLVWNEDARPEAYDTFKDCFRPSHADYTYQSKYGVRDWRGGGRSSARETVGRVAAGALAKSVLKQLHNIDILGWVERVHHITADFDIENLTLEQVESTPTRCPDLSAAEKIIKAIEQARRDGVSLGGVVGCKAHNVPAGLGSPVFDKLSADLAKGIMSIPACKGFEVGSGFSGTTMTGAEHNDEFYLDNQHRIRTKTNHSGGIQGGISNGEDILVRAAFKPTATIMREQNTVDIEMKPTVMKAKGRHDPCVLPRAVPIVEAMMAIVLLDHVLLNRGQCGD